MKRSTLFLICLLLFVLLVGGGTAWMYFTPGGLLSPNQPDEAVQALLESRDSSAWREEFVRLCTPTVSEFEDAATVADDLFTAATSGQGFSFRRDSESDSRSEPVYILSAGETDILRLKLHYDRSAGAWEITSEVPDTLRAETRDLTVTVPEGTAVSVNGVPLGEEYISDDAVPYDNISDLESQFSDCPHRVTYTVPGIYESVEVNAEREDGVLLLYSDGTVWDYTVPDAAAYSFRVTAPQEASVSADGVLLGDAQAVSYSALPTHVDIPDELIDLLPVYTVYAAGGLYHVPEFTASLPDGTELVQTTDSDGYPSFEMPGDETLWENCHERVESYLRELAEYGAGHTAQYSPVNYVLPGVALNNYFTYSRDTLQWTVGVTLEFGDVSTWGYVSLGDNAFLCQGEANFTTTTRYQTKDLTVDYEMLWVNQNGTWYIRDMSFL